MEKYASIVSLGAGPNQVRLIQRAKEIGFCVIAVDRDGQAPGFQISDIKLKISTHDRNSIIEELVKLSASCNLKGVVARTTGKALYTASAISRKFSLPGISDVIAKISTEKANLREFLSGHNLPVPKGRKISPDEPEKLDIPCPLVVKPDFPHTGKKDVTVVTEEQVLGSYVAAASRSSENRYVEIEQYIDGIDVSCMFLADKGNARIIACWDEHVAVMRSGAVSSLGISTPSVTHGTAAEMNMKKVVSKFTSMFPDVSAILVLSFRVDIKGNPHVIELHADLTGDLILDVLLPASCKKFDPWTIILKVSTNQTIPLPSVQFVPTCLYYGGDTADPLQKQDLIQGPSLRSSLESFYKIVRTGRQDILWSSKHLDWYQENAGGKAIT